MDNNSFRKYEVKANSLDDFLKTYTKQSVINRGQEHHEARLESHQKDIEKYGYTFITHHDSRTGEIVSYYPNN